MPPLPSDLRSKLERAIIDAREVAEIGAQAALEAMAVHHYDPYPHQSPEQRKLRNHLRAHARQLGDQQKDSSGRLHIGHLIHECAYEHWHRMLFARFLTENDLLIEPSSGMAISLQECEELAKEAKTDLWTFASRCAQQMLPQIFRPDDPLLQVTLAREHRGKLEVLLNGIPSAVFKADDALGWVYQFWQSKKKDEVNASENKITGDTLPVVTQLFTEHYMVLYLLHNTLGAWHAGKVLSANPKLAEKATDENELRRAVALKSAGGYSFDYLRFVRGSDGKDSQWRPAAGVFDGWPKRAAELKALDPCCGSGHFLVALFELLLRLRMDEEGLSTKDAADAVLRDNIFGLELDARCTQIAAFNLALAAWRQGGYRSIPILHIACSGLAPNTTEQEWVNLAGKNARLHAGMERLYQLFQMAPVLGSLINPRALGGDMLIADFQELQPLLDKAMLRDPGDEAKRELAVAAQGIAKAAEILVGQFTLVATNVPYLGRGKQDDILKKYCAHTHPEAKADLATCFVERCLDFCCPNGIASVVTPQNWLFLSTYKKLRSKLLQDSGWNTVARLGPHAFETIGGEVVSVVLLSLEKTQPSRKSQFLGTDAALSDNAQAKADHLAHGPFSFVSQEAQLGNPDYKILLVERGNESSLSTNGVVSEGLHTGDYPRFGRKHWEIPAPWKGWSLQQGGTEDGDGSGGCEHILFWQDGHGELIKFVEERLGGSPLSMWIKGEEVWGKRGVAVGAMTLKHSPYLGALFTHGIVAIVPDDENDLAALTCYIESQEFKNEIRLLDQKVCVARASFEQIPFDRDRWLREAAKKYPKGLPEPESSVPTQWIFPGRPEQSSAPLQAAVARLLGYRWPAELDKSLPLSSRARELVKACDALLKHADTDGIVCIPALRGENSAADKLGALLAACDIKPDKNIDDWLRNSFFEEHCQLFQHRPFIWHVWDGRKRDGFHALVNYHKLSEGDGKGRKLLGSLTYSYLGEWIKRQQDGVKRGEEGAEDRLTAATELQKRLESILLGEPPFDIFTRWKPLQQQPIGWEPDINDGVRMNIRPFLAEDLPTGRTGAGVLRWKPNIKWDKDRGKEPHRSKAEFPWFWGWDEESKDFMGGKSFTGERFNDCHYTTAVKLKAREAVEKIGSKR